MTDESLCCESVCKATVTPCVILVRACFRGHVRGVFLNTWGESVARTQLERINVNRVCVLPHPYGASTEGYTPLFGTQYSGGV